MRPAGRERLVQWAHFVECRVGIPGGKGGRV
jgi:hypothetical protein